MTKLKVTSPTGLEWTVKRLVVPVGMRPHPPSALMEMAASRRLATLAPTGPLPLGYLVLLPVMLPFLPVIVLLRALRLLPWTLEASAYPWGRRFPPIFLLYQTRGRAEADLAVEQLAEALARGDGAPVVAGAERVQ